MVSETPAARTKRVLTRCLVALKAARAELRRPEPSPPRARAPRLRQLEREVERGVDLKATSTSFEGGLGNRPATDTYRNRQVAGFMESVNELGLLARKYGPEAARFAVRTGVRANLAMLYATAPASIEEARRRDLLRVLFSNPASAAVLGGTEEWHERFREDLINLALNSGVEASTWMLVKRSAENSETITESK